MDQFRRGYRTPPLTKQLKNILDQYPDDGQILKELIQNAEDAGATEMKFLLDNSYYGTDPNKLIHPGLAQFQGPALYAYNNAEFSDADWESIAMLLFSKKEDDPMKVGRYGMGFKSVYHMTDLPSLVSGDAIGFMDPHERYFKDSKHGDSSCSLWKFSEDWKAMRKLDHQFRPFYENADLFGLPNKTFTEGLFTGKTLFRFPLRSPEAKYHSELSDNVYTPEKVRQLLNDLEKDGGKMLLFLMHLQHIEVYERTPDHKKNALEKTLDIRIDRSCLKIVTDQRLKFDTFLDVLKTGKMMDKTLSVSFPIKFVVESGFNTKKFHSSQHTFIVTHYYNDGMLTTQHVKQAKDSLKVLPWVGAAIPLDSGLVASEVQGQIYSFLPLPLEARSPTGLSTHVHGYFVLDQNRRHLKWPDAGSNNVSDRHHVWNIFLMKELLPQALIKMAEYISRLQSGTQVPEHLRVVANFKDMKRIAQFQVDILNSVMPNLQRINPGWLPLAETFYKEIVRHQVFYSEVKDGTWLSIYDKETIVDDSDKTTDLAKLLRKILIASDKNLVSVPGFIMTGIERFNDSLLRRIQPEDICACLKTNSVALSNEEKLRLLPYLLEKLDKTRQLCHLIGTPLLPLDNGAWIKFQSSSLFQSLPLTTEIYIESLEHPQDLLPGLKSKFISSRVKDNKVLQSIAKAGSMQLKMLDKNSILQLLRLVPGLAVPHQVSLGIAVSLLPEQTVIIPNATASLTQKYFERLWQYIETHCTTDLRTLANSKLYLVPFNQCTQLALLSENLPFIVWETGKSGPLKTALKSLGVFVLDDLPTFVSRTRDIMGKYILRPTLSGMLELLSRIKARCRLGNLAGRFESLSAEEKDALRQNIGSKLAFEQIGDSGKGLIRSLPIFRTLDQSGFKPQHFVSLETVGLAVSSSFHLPVKVPSVLIQCMGPDSESLKQSLDIRVLNEAEVLCTLVFPAINSANSAMYSPTMIEETMKFSLKNLELFERQHAGFIKSVSQLRFLSNGKGQTLKMPSELFDDSFPLLKDFFTCNNFPFGEFSKEIYRQALKKAELKGPDKISVDNFLATAKDIHDNPAKLTTQKKAFAMLTLLNSSLKSGVFSKREKMRLNDQLRSLKWVPPCRHRPKDYPEFLAFLGETSPLLAPQNVYEHTFCHVVGSVQPTVDLQGMEHLVELFECASEPTVKEVVRHLDNIASSYSSEEDRTACNKRKLRDTTGERQVDRKTTKVCETIYEFLNERVENNQKYLSTLSEKKYILVNGHFMKPSHCALQSQFSCPPFMCGLPDVSCKSLWQTIGVKAQFDVDSYVEIVQQIYDDIGLQPLSTSQLSMFIKIIGECTSSAEEGHSMEGKEVYLPDHKGILRLASQLCFNDSPWLPITQNENARICHHRVAYPDAQKLGVKSWRQKTVQGHCRKLPGFHKFGQKEKLVNRLKRILEGYPINDGILKELVQNADDAGATRIHFIKDMRTLSSDKIFDKKWKPVQGASLCVYNDKSFTEQDIQGIQDLGEGSKSKERTKIGQYGVGFNCVYHLTDVPTFITTVDKRGRVLCVLDPTLQHVDDATEESPGCMFDDLGTLTKMFPDVFNGYLGKYYGTSGTVFRFPLRTSKSAISDNVATEETIGKLFRIMKNEMDSCLLFLNNVREIALKEIRPNGQLVDIFCVKARLNIEDQKTLNSFKNTSKEICSELEKDGSLESIKAKDIMYTMETSDTNNDKHQWLIAQKLGFDNPSCVSEKLKAAYKSGALNHLPLGGVAYEMRQTQKKVDSKLFCFLPLPKPIHLPVHINGHFCLDTESRRNLIEDDKDEIQKDWNECLMKNVVAQAYCSIIQKAKDSANQEIENCKRNPRRRGGMDTSNEDILKNYQLVFPNISNTDGRYVRIMCVSVYEMLWKLNLPVLPVYSASPCTRNSILNINWVGPQGTGSKKPSFDHLMSEVAGVFKEQSDIRSTRDAPDHTKIGLRLRKMLISFGFSLVHSSCQLYYEFTRAGLTVVYSSPDTVLEFFAGFKKENSSCRMPHLPLRLTDTPFESVEVFETVLQYCSNSKNFSASLKSAPFLLTADEYLREFDEGSKPYSSSYCDLVPHALHMFAHRKIKSIIRDVGMTRNFNVVDLVGLLSGILPEKYFFGDDKFVRFEFFTHFLQKQVPVKLTVPPEQLLKRIWEFITQYAVAKDYPHLSSWCLLPVTSVEGNFLLPVSRASHVIETSKVETVDPKLLKALNNIGMPVLDNNYVSSYTIEKLLNVSVHLSVAIVKHFIGHKGCVLNVTEERSSLLRYLSYNQDEWKSTDGACPAICRLPVFEYYDGTIGGLQKSKRYIVPPNIPHNESSKWASEDDTLFLNYSSELFPFLIFLGCENIQEDQVYCQFIFKRFAVLSNVSRLTHLTFVRDNLIHQLRYCPDRLERLQNDLHNLKFLSRSNGTQLRCASTFFDGSVDIFQIMQNKLDFPPKPFNTDDWLDFLRFCGLVHEVTDDHLLRYAEEIARETKDADDEEPVRKKAKIVVENIMKLEDLPDSFAEKLKTMPIVEAAVVSKEMKKIHLQKSNQRGPFISYKDAYEEKYKDLVWTTSGMLPNWATATRKRKLEKLEVQAKPLTEVVAQHLVNICKSFLKASKKRKAEVKEEFFRVTKEIYKFLGSNDVSDASKSLLANCQCIVLDSGTELARPDQVVITLSEEKEIRPYLYRLSRDLCEYLPFFEKLKMAQDLLPEHYAGVLHEIHKKVDQAELIPNDRKLVLMAFAGFLKQLRNNNSLTLKQLSLPSDNGRLYNSSKLVINDDVEFAERAGKCKSLLYIIDLDDLKEFGESDVTYKIFEKLPEFLRPSLLSGVVTQKLAEVPKLSGKTTRSNRLRDTIASQEFTDGLFRLLNLQLDTMNKSTLIEKIKDLSKIQIYELPKVVTYLEHNKKRIPSSEKECGFFITNNGTAEATVTVVYIDKNLHTNAKESNILNIKLAEIVNELLDGALKMVLAYVPPLFQCDPREIDSTLDRLGRPGSGSSNKREQRPFLPKLGSFVPINMHHMLQQGFFTFKKGDFAALEYGELEDSIYIMVEIVEDISEECHSDSMLNARYRVNTGENGEHIVNGSDLYKFCSQPCFDEATGAIVLVPIPSETNFTAPRNVEESLNYNDIIIDIKKSLIEARSLPEDQKRRVIKRLYLRWHPDKNPPHLSKVCTQIVQTLQHLVNRLDSLSLEEEEEGDNHESSTSQDFPDSSYRQSRFRSRNRTSASRENFNYQNFNFGCFDETAKKHKEQSGAYYNASSSSSRQQDFFSFGEAFTSRPNPQPQEAKRWMRQAEFDLASAAIDSAQGFYEWSCYKYHQAAEKSLKAIQFKRDANQNFTHNLSSLCSGLDDQAVKKWVIQLERLIPNPAAMRYPNNQNYPRVPHDVYGVEMTEKVRNLATNIVRFAQDQLT